MNLRVGTVTGIQGRFLTVTLYHTGQVITEVAKTGPLNHDEREQRLNIKIGTEVLIIEDNYGVTYAISSLSQGIDLIKGKNSRVENDEVQVYGKEIKLMGADGDNVSTVEKKAEHVDIWTSKINIRNDSTNIIQLLADLCQAVADDDKGEAMSIKSKIEAYL